MPQLPSGKHLAISSKSLIDLMNDSNDGVRVRELMEITKIEDLLPHLSILFFKVDETNSATSQKHGLNPNFIPDNLVPYESGFNLFTIQKIYSSWSAEDVSAFKLILESGQYHDYTAKLFKDVQTLQSQIINWSKLGEIFEDEEGAELLRLIRSDK